MKIEVTKPRKQSDWDRKRKPFKGNEEKPAVSHHKSKKQKYVRYSLTKK